MTKTEIKNAANNKLVTRLADIYGTIVASNGSRTKGFVKEMNLVMDELKSRGLLEDEDIEYLNS